MPATCQTRCARLWCMQGRAPAPAGLQPPGTQPSLEAPPHFAQASRPCHEPRGVQNQLPLGINLLVALL